MGAKKEKRAKPKAGILRTLGAAVAVAAPALTPTPGDGRPPVTQLVTGVKNKDIPGAAYSIIGYVKSIVPAAPLVVGGIAVAWGAPKLARATHVSHIKIFGHPIA